MRVLPEALASYGLATVVAERKPAWFCVGADSRVARSGGSLDVYGLDGLRRGTDPFEVAPFLVGLLPIGDTDFSIPLLHVGGHRYADVHFVARQRQDWVLLLLADREAEARFVEQQAKNELALELERRGRGAATAPGAAPERAPGAAAAVLDGPATEALVAVLSALDVAAFEPAGPAAFTAVAPVPEAFVRRFPALDRPVVDLAEEFAFLGHFLEEARACWTGAARDSCRSGIWTETDVGGAERRLEATALRQQGRALLLLELADQRHDRLHEIVQGARETTLALDKLRHAQAALLESEQRFRALADAAPVMIWMSDGDDRFFYFNRTWLAFTGQPLARETGEGWLRGVHPDDAAAVRRSLWRHFAEQRGFELEFRLRRHDGTYRWVLNSSIPRFTDSGGLAGHVGCCIDIDERKQAMSVLERSRSELERRVAERTAELVETNRRLEEEVAERRRAHEQLLAYQEDLRSLADQLTLAEERERRRLAAELHDHVGQNLAVAKIRLGMLGAAGPSADARDEIGLLRRLVEETIEYTRTLTFELASPALYELGLEAALEGLARRMQERYGLPATFRDDGAAKPLGENLRTILFQAVRELLHNVGKHAHAALVTVSVRREGRWIVVEVVDDGVGFRAPGPGEPARGGFGLFNVRERLEHLGGTVAIRSKPGAGARVVLRAPLSEET